MITGFAPAVSAAPGPVVTATIPVGDDPQGIGVDPHTGTVYVANEGDNTVSVISEATGTVTATIPVGTRPLGAAVDPDTGTVYVPNVGGGVSVISEATDTVTATITLDSAPPLPTAAAVDPSTGTVYTADADGTLSVISEATDTVTDTLCYDPNNNCPFPEPVEPDRTVGVDPSTGNVYMTDTALDTVRVFRGSAEVDSISIPFIPVNAVAVDPVTGNVYLASDSDTLFVISEATNTVTATIPVNDSPPTQGLAVDPATGTIYASDDSTDTVSLISEATGTVTATVPVGAGPTGVGVDPVTGNVYVANAGDDTVSLLATPAATPQPVDTTLKLTASADPATAGQAVTLCATVTAADGSSPAGSVLFAAPDGTAIGPSVPVSGGTACTTTTFAAPGTDSLSAVFVPLDTGEAYVFSTGQLSLPVQAAGADSGTGTGTGTGSLPLGVSVPAIGSFTLTVDPGTVALADSGGNATASLNPITVTDTRNSYPGWSVYGQDSPWTGSGSASGGAFSGDQLGWGPTSSTTPLTQGVTLGATVTAASPGLGDAAAVLASAQAGVGNGYGTTTLGAGLTLAIPPTAPPGQYTSELTISAVPSNP